MGCCSSTPTCELTRSETDPMDAIALDALMKSPVPFALPYVAKIIRGKTRCEFSQLAAKLANDTVPINSFKIDGLDPAPYQQLRDPMKVLITMAVSQVNREALRSLLAAATKLVRGASDEPTVRRCAEEALRKAAEVSVMKQVNQFLERSRQDIESFSSASFSPGSMARAGSPGVVGPSVGGGFGKSAAGPPPPQQQQQQPQPQQMNSNSNNNNNPGFQNNQQQQQPLPQNNNQQQQPVQNNNNQFSTPQKSVNNQQQAQFATTGAPDSPVDHRHGYSGTEQQFYDSMRQYEEVQQAGNAQAQDYASPTNEAWSRYPIPEENGPWVPVNEAFYWSESAELYYFPAAGHFFHPESAMWFDPVGDKWMDEAAHEKLLEEMARHGLY
jgi:hypothetical protein